MEYDKIVYVKLGVAGVKSWIGNRIKYINLDYKKELDYKKQPS